MVSCYVQTLAGKSLQLKGMKLANVIGHDSHSLKHPPINYDYVNFMIQPSFQCTPLDTKLPRVHSIFMRL